MVAINSIDPKFFTKQSCTPTLVVTVRNNLGTLNIPYARPSDGLAYDDAGVYGKDKKKLSRVNAVFYQYALLRENMAFKLGDVLETQTLIDGDFDDAGTGPKLYEVDDEVTNSGKVQPSVKIPAKKFGWLGMIPSNDFDLFRKMTDTQKRIALPFLKMAEDKRARSSGDKAAKETIDEQSVYFMKGILSM